MPAQLLLYSRAPIRPIQGSMGFLNYALILFVLLRGDHAVHHAAASAAGTSNAEVLTPGRDRPALSGVEGRGYNPRMKITHVVAVAALVCAASWRSTSAHNSAGSGVRSHQNSRKSRKRAPLRTVSPKASGRSTCSTRCGSRSCRGWRFGTSSRTARRPSSYRIRRRREERTLHRHRQAQLHAEDDPRRHRPQAR